MGTVPKVTFDTTTCTTWLPATAAATVITIWVLPTNAQYAVAVPLTVANEAFTIEKKPEG